MPVADSEMRPGNASVRTDARSTGMGLSINAGGGTGRQTNVGDFCCPEYLGTMVHRIRQNWNSGRGTTATTTMTFTIQRDGTITDVRLSRSSGNQMLDFLAERALLAVRQLPPLPDAYPHPSLILDLEFNYQR
jgi:periplasmic protein TonB